jgi:transcriptional regulator with XRE-family HTH domain
LVLMPTLIRVSPIFLDIRARREKRGWSQGDLARASGVPQQTISRLERVGFQKGVEFDTLERIARALGVHPRVLLVLKPRRRARRR